LNRKQETNVATNCTISVEHADGTISSIYCHWDGYPTGVGSDLVLRFNTLESAETLVALGDLSTVCDEVYAYHRDDQRHWDDVKPVSFDSYNELNEALVAEGYGEKYNYLFKTGRWLVLHDDLDSRMLKWENVEDVIRAEKEDWHTMLTGEPQ